MKLFGSVKVFSELLVDFKDLQKNVITAGGEPVKGALYCIAADNLGPHGIAGYTENLSRTFASTVK